MCEATESVPCRSRGQMLEGRRLPIRPAGNHGPSSLLGRPELLPQRRAAPHLVRAAWTTHPQTVTTSTTPTRGVAVQPGSFKGSRLSIGLPLGRHAAASCRTCPRWYTECARRRSGRDRRRAPRSAMIVGPMTPATTEEGEEVPARCPGRDVAHRLNHLAGLPERTRYDGSGNGRCSRPRRAAAGVVVVRSSAKLPANCHAPARRRYARIRPRRNPTRLPVSTAISAIRRIWTGSRPAGTNSENGNASR